MVPEFVARTGGSKWASALPTGSKWKRALPVGKPKGPGELTMPVGSADQ